MKYEWKKEDKDLYCTKKRAHLITVPNYNYYTITGKGNPNSEEFSLKVGALYTASFGINKITKRGITPEGFFDYTVFPLEGLWSLDTEIEETLNKEELHYKIMIRQPKFVTDIIAKENLEYVQATKSNPYLKEVTFEKIAEGKCVQILHVGPYDDEPETFKRMDTFLDEHGLQRTCGTHKEIYLVNPLRAKPQNVKTILRYYVK